MSKRKKDNSTIATLIKFCCLAIFIVVFVFLCFLFVYNNSNFLQGAGLEFYVVEADDMYTELNKNDLIVIRRVEARFIREGDIISFYDENKDKKTLSKVITIIESDEGWLFQVKKDTDEFVYEQSLTESDILGLYWFKVPLVGPINCFLTSKYGVITVAINIWVVFVMFVLWKFYSR